MNNRILGALFVAATFICAIQDCSAANAQSRVALVVGNGSYRHGAGLRTPVADATEIGAALGRLGFAVTRLTDASYDAFRKALLEFGQAARRADIAAIYFAGYGIEVNGENWMIPTDAKLQSDTDVLGEAIELSKMMVSVSAARELGLVIVDASREHPFAATMERLAKSRNDEPGLAMVEPSDNVLVAFSAKAGTIAGERPGRLSPYTDALLKNLETPGLEISYMFRNVREDVLDATNDEQEPGHYGTLPERESFLVPALASPVYEVASTNAVPTADEIAWSFLSDSVDIPSLKKFVEQFSSSVYTTDARKRIEILQAPAQVLSSGGPAADEIAWMFLGYRADLASLRRFIDQFPDSVHVAAARDWIERLEKQVSTGTSASKPVHAPSLTGNPIEKPLAGSPVEKHQAQIARRFPKGHPNIDTAWQFLKNTSDVHAVQKFAAAFPERKYAAGAKTRLSELGVPSRPARRPGGQAPSVDADYYVGQCNQIGGDFNRAGAGALDACRHAVTARPNVSGLQFNLCLSLIRAGNHRQALGHCFSAVDYAQADGDPSLAKYRETAKAVLPFVGNVFGRQDVALGQTQNTGGGGAPILTGGPPGLAAAPGGGGGPPSGPSLPNGPGQNVPDLLVSITPNSGDTKVTADSIQAKGQILPTLVTPPSGKPSDKLPAGGLPTPTAPAGKPTGGASAPGTATAGTTTDGPVHRPPARPTGAGPTGSDDLMGGSAPGRNTVHPQRDAEKIARNPAARSEDHSGVSSRSHRDRVASPPHAEHPSHAEPRAVKADVSSAGSRASAAASRASANIAGNAAARVSSNVASRVSSHIAGNVASRVSSNVASGVASNVASRVSSSVASSVASRVSSRIPGH